MHLRPCPNISDGNFRECSQPADIYLFKVNNRNARKRCGICSTLTIKTPERCQCRNLFFTELQASLSKRDSDTDVVLMFLLLTHRTYFNPFSSVSIVDLELVDVGCPKNKICFCKMFHYGFLIGS